MGEHRPEKLSQLVRASPEEVTRVGGPSPFPAHTPPPALAVKARSKAPAGSRPPEAEGKGLSIAETGAETKPGGRWIAQTLTGCEGSGWCGLYQE